MHRGPVVFNGVELYAGQQVGAHRYLRELLKRVGTLLPDEDLVLLVPEGGDPGETYPNIRTVQYGKVSPSKFGRRILWQNGPLVRYVKDHDALGVDLTIGLPRAGFTYVSLMDTIREDFPQERAGLANAAKYRAYQRRLHHALASGADIITLSEHSRCDIVDHYGIDSDRIHIVGCGWEHMATIEEDASVCDKLGLERRGYYFSLGTQLYHKNHAWVIEAARRNPGLIFVVTGGGKGAADGESPANVIHTGYVSDGQMKALMRNAKALIEPSFAEGFGLPPLEALSLGTPAIVAQASCLPEVYSDTVTYFDPKDPGFDFAAFDKQRAADSASLLREHSWKNSAQALAELIEAKR